MAVTDEELVVRVRDGDETSLAVLYRRHAARVYAIANHLVGDPLTCEEIVQDVFTRIWRTHSYSPTRGVFQHWITAVARSVTLDHLRQQRHVPAIIDADRADEFADRRALRDLDTRLLRADLVLSMAALRKEERNVIELTYFQGYTLSEVSRLLRVPEGTVKTRLRRGLRILRTKLDNLTSEVRQ